MGQPQPAVEHFICLDLTAPSPFQEEVAALQRLRIHGSFSKAVAAVAAEQSYTKRVTRLNETLREIDTDESVFFTLAAGKLALRGDAAGLRVLCSLLNVKRPGVEVLKRLQALSSLERVSLQLISGRWKQAAGDEEENPAFAIIELINEATRIGVLDLGLQLLPKRHSAIHALVDHIRHWFAWMSLKLSAGQTLAADTMAFLVQLCMLEVSLTEKRVSRIAGSIDPYDVYGMARLMPIMSRYDQDIEHMKTVVSQITTYRPFYEREMSIEVAITESEIQKLQKALLKNGTGRCLAEVIQQMRANPILEREYLFLVSVVYQIACLRALHGGKSQGLDVLSTMYEVLDVYREGRPLPIRIESAAVDAMWDVIQTWGVVERIPEGLLLQYREDRSLDFINDDGTPRLPMVPTALEKLDLSIEELVRSQMHNDAVILGILENPKALAKPRVIPLIALHSRSIRVLQKIITVRTLHTGPANKDVPRLILMNPARLSITNLRRFINVRFVSKTDLNRMATGGSDIRPEVRKEIALYLKSLN